MRTARTITSLLLALVVAAVGLVAAPAPADAATCSTGYLWVTHQNGFAADAVTPASVDTLAGTRICPANRPHWNDDDGAKSWGGWALNSTKTRWVTATRIPPRTAGTGIESRIAARMLADLADQYNVRVQLAERNAGGDAGWINSNGWVITGTYAASTYRGGKAGTGIIRLGVGTAPLGAAGNDAAYRKNLKKTFLHETGHVTIERKCGTHAPPIVGSRSENVTDAYATYYFGMTSANYGFTAKDLWRAKQIHAGRCA